MPNDRHFVACHLCDTLHEAAPLAKGKAARCARCGATLYSNRSAPMRRAVAFSLTAIIAMVLAQIFPFLTLDVAALRSELTLWGTACSLIQNDEILLGISVILFAILAPLILSGGLIYVGFPLIFHRALPGAKQVTKWIFLSEPWNMAEVFLLGVLVSLMKLAHMAEVHFGIGFWAFAAVMLCLAAALAGLDKRELWERLEEAGKYENA